ncbi:MAG: outer membrane beta-barrel protein, partial [Longimicrobiales bacterium]
MMKFLRSRLQSHKRVFLALVLLVLPAALSAQQDTAAVRKDTAVTVTFGGFADTCLAVQFERSEVGDIPFLTQPVRNKEFNINLMFVAAKLNGPRLRGRIALQAGTSVMANYVGEPRIGLFSGPELTRLIQEAVAGYYIGSNVWIDGGIYFSHVGSESWISRDNWTYTRSLIAEWLPCYESGFKATWTPSSKFTGLFTVVNGWQNIFETNNDKGVGIRLDFAPSSAVSVFYSNFIGNELADTLDGRTRFLNDIGFKVLFGERAGLMGTFDYGAQDVFDWWGFSLIARVKVADMAAVVGRVERFSDPDQVLIGTGLA